MFDELSAVSRRLLSKNLRKLHKAGLLDSCNDLTDKGLETLEAIVLEDYMDAMIEEAEKVIEDEE